MRDIVIIEKLEEGDLAMSDELPKDEEQKAAEEGRVTQAQADTNKALERMIDEKQAQADAQAQKDIDDRLDQVTGGGSSSEDK